MIEINPVHIAYVFMIIGVVFCFIFSQREGEALREEVNRFAKPFVLLSNHISPEPPSSGLNVEHDKYDRNKLTVLPLDQQSGTMRAIISRANDEESVKLFAEMAEAAQEIERKVGRNRTKKVQYVEPINEILTITHTFLTGCENTALICTEGTKGQFDSFLFQQVKHRMVLMRRIKGSFGDEYKELCANYMDEIEAEARKQDEAARNRNKGKTRKNNK